MKNKLVTFISEQKYPLIFLLLLTVYAYYNLWNTFFVADAWHMLDSYIQAKDYGISYFFQLFAMPYGIHFVPIAILFSTAQGYFFGINVIGYGSFSLFLHFINVILIFYSILYSSKRKVIAFLGAAFFAVNAQIREGVFWFASNTWTEMGTTLVLLGLLQLLLFYKNRKTSTFFVSFFCFFSSVFLREYSFMLFPVNILFLLSLYLKDKKKKYLLFSLLYLIVIIVYFILRFVFVYAVNPVVLSSANISKDHLIYLVPWYIITLPAKVIATIFIPSDWMVSIASFIAENIYFELDIAQTAIFKTVLFYDQLFLFFGAVFFVITIYLYSKAKTQSKEALVALRLYGISFYFIPLIFLTLSNYIYWTFSRYLYLPAAIFIIFLFSTISFIPVFKTRNFISFATFLVCIIMIGLNAFFNNAYFASYVTLGNYRQHVIRRISAKIQWQKKQQVIFVKTTTEGFTNGNDIFGVGTSFGKELLIWNWYQGNNKVNLPSCLYDPMFLFVDTLNGYEQCQGKGYGYFQDINKLQKAVKKYKIDKNNIIGFNYDMRKDTFTDISGEIRKKLQK